MPPKLLGYCLVKLYNVKQGNKITQRVKSLSILNILISSQGNVWILGKTMKK